MRGQCGSGAPLELANGDYEIGFLLYAGLFAGSGIWFFSAFAYGTALPKLSLPAKCPTCNSEVLMGISPLTANSNVWLGHKMMCRSHP